MSAPSIRARRAALAALLACAAAGASAPTASAFFVVPKCGGEGVTGRGASFMNGAQQGFAAGFSSAACPGHPGIAYEPLGSGAGRRAMGGDTAAPGTNTGVRDKAVRFAGSDEGPSLTSQTAMNAGLPGTADDATVRILPVAAGAVAMTVNYPNVDANTACPIPNGYRAEGPTDSEDRLRLPNAKLERAWAGLFATWGDLLDGAETGAVSLASLNAACAAKPLVRIVRSDSSGTTFAFKDFLNRVRQDLRPAGTDWRGGTEGTSSSGNQKWPNTLQKDTDGNTATDNDANDYGFDTPLGGTCDTAYVEKTGAYAGQPGNPVCRPGPISGTSTANGAGPQNALLAQTDGAIGYGDLFTAVDRGFKKQADAADTTYWMPLAVRGSTSNFVEPSLNQDGWRSGQPTGGANCNVSVNDIPSGTDPTSSTGWDATSMVYPSAGYGDCSLTYMLAWDDNAPVYLNLPGTEYNAEERKARAMKDYLDYIVSDAGQQTLVAQEYAVLPPLVLGIVRGGVAKIDWDKANTGNRSPDSGDDDGDGGGTGGGGSGGGGGGGGGGGTGGGTTAPAPAPPAPLPTPAPISNAFTIPSARTRGTDIVTSFRLPGPGQLVVAAQGRYTEVIKRKGRRSRSRLRSVTVARAAVSVSRAGDVSVRLPQSRAARNALRKARGKRMTVTITATFTPAGGQPNTVTRQITIKGR